MIVVDTNVIAYFWLPDPQTSYARAALKRDPAWVAPAYWRNEFRNVLVSAMKTKGLRLKDAIDIHSHAIAMMRGAEFDVPGDRVLEFADRSDCTAYDCEFAVLADELHTSLVTADRKVLRAFPELTISLKKFAEG